MEEEPREISAEDVNPELNVLIRELGQILVDSLRQKGLNTDVVRYDFALVMIRREQKGENVEYDMVTFSSMMRTQLVGEILRDVGNTMLKSRNEHGDVIDVPFRGRVQ